MLGSTQPLLTDDAPILHPVVLSKILRKGLLVEEHRNTQVSRRIGTCLGPL